ncbi:TerB family tellurite resistance protein [Croceiramulus getboli]|nr:TerB family tellurite resistance protein [Flavobacteriaceae bacterium YJPT1-3]
MNTDLYDNDFVRRNEDHFAAIVKVAMMDGEISEEEKQFLDRLAQNLSISEEEYAEILKDYMKHPINPPYTYDHRLERLYDLSRMVHLDPHFVKQKEAMLGRMAIGLGFNPANAPYVVDKALKLVDQGVSLEVFTEEIKHMNR